jgi:hypothetical protein
MKKFLWIGLVVAVAAVIVAVSCSKKSTDSGGGGGMGTSSWTVMVYGAGNNNLDTLNNATSYIIQDVQDMEKVGSQSGILSNESGEVLQSGVLPQREPGCP